MVTRAFPFPIQEVQTDHSTEFTYVFFYHVHKPHPFEKALGALGFRHKLIPVGSPAERQGSRSHRTLNEECLNSGPFRKPKALATKHWKNFYNSQRAHSALQSSTPLQKLRSFQPYRTVTHVLKSFQRKPLIRPHFRPPKSL